MAALTDAVQDGAAVDVIADVEVIGLDALAFARGEADHRDLLAADGYLLGSTANFGYMSGALKHMFDATFLHIGGALDALPTDEQPASTRGRPFGVFLHGRYDTEGALRSITSITGALGWRQAAPHLQVLGAPTDADLESAWELGATLAAILSP